MITMISLDDKEESNAMLVSIDSEYSGAMIFCTNQRGDKVSLLVDSRLLKQLCNEVSKAIMNKATKSNECGFVKKKELQYE